MKKRGNSCNFCKAPLAQIPDSQRSKLCWISFFYIGLALFQSTREKGGRRCLEVQARQAYSSTYRYDNGESNDIIEISTTCSITDTTSWSDTIPTISVALPDDDVFISLLLLKSPMHRVRTAAGVTTANSLSESLKLMRERITVVCLLLSSTAWMDGWRAMSLYDFQILVYIYSTYSHLWIASFTNISSGRVNMEGNTASSVLILFSSMSTFVFLSTFGDIPIPGSICPGCT